MTPRRLNYISQHSLRLLPYYFWLSSNFFPDSEYKPAEPLDILRVL